MIALSDVFILTASSAILAVALVRSYGSDHPRTDRPSPQTSGWIQSGTSSINPPPNTLTPSQLGKPIKEIREAAGESLNQGTGQDNSQGTSQTTGTDQGSGQGSSQNSTTATVTTPAPTTPLYATYVVRSGDSLSKIANLFNTTVRELQSINNLTGTRILVGQRLQYPAP